MKRLAALLLILFSARVCLVAEPAADAKILDLFAARPIGPANMGGRIVDLAVVDSNPKTFYVAAASGGVWKTTDAGEKFTPIFDGQATQNIGAIAVAPSNPDIVWVGGGEANPRNSVAWGDGVYKSADGGKTWQHMGLKDTQHVGRIAIHPKDPEVVYVAALGHVWGPNKDRGLYKTEDGGNTWHKSKFIDENTGFIDVAIDPAEPDVVYAAAWCVRRDAFSGGNPATQTGPGGGLFRSPDGGKTWAKMTDGLPDRPYGRCGISICRKDPRIVMAVIQTDQTTVTVQGQPQKANSDNIDKGGIFRSEDKGKTWKKLNDLCPRPFYYGQIRIDPTDEQRVYTLGIAFHISKDGGKTFPATGMAAKGVHPDHHALWINPADSSHLILGNDGGLYVTRDRCASWQAIRNLPLGQFYAVAANMQKPYKVYGGLQDNGSWGGPSATYHPDGIALDDWRKIFGMDGFYCACDPTDPNIAYAEGQYGRLQRIDVKTAKAKAIAPQPAKGKAPYRFNWSSPLVLSKHDPKTLYYGGNHLFRSSNRGDSWEVLSGDLTRAQPGPVKNSGHTISALAESPRLAGLLYVGTDDGRLHVTRNSGTDWTDLTDKVPGVPPERWISRVECSYHAEGTAYLAIDRHRNDDRRPYLFKTTDHGQTWLPLANNLPESPVYVIRESSKNRDLLFLGNEHGLFVSTDGGLRWQRFGQGLPPVAVHDLLIHPRDRELIVATHGRSVWVIDIAPLEDLNSKTLASDVYLCDVKPAVAYPWKLPNPPPSAKVFHAPNPPYGAQIHFYLKDKLAGPVTLSIADAEGKMVTAMTETGRAGLNRIAWSLKGSGGETVKPGEYTATLKIGEKSLAKKLKVEASE